MYPSNYSRFNVIINYVIMLITLNYDSRLTDVKKRQFLCKNLISYILMVSIMLMRFLMRKWFSDNV